MHLAEFRSRLLVFVQWSIEYVSYNRSARLITGTDLPPGLPYSQEDHAQGPRPPL
jgi:hypothetical protein